MKKYITFSEDQTSSYLHGITEPISPKLLKLEIYRQSLEIGCLKQELRLEKEAHTLYRDMYLKMITGEV